MDSQGIEGDGQLHEGAVAGDGGVEGGGFRLGELAEEDDVQGDGLRADRAAPGAGALQVDDHRPVENRGGGIDGAAARAVREADIAVGEHAFVVLREEVGDRLLRQGWDRRFPEPERRAVDLDIGQLVPDHLEAGLRIGDRQPGPAGRNPGARPGRDR